MGSKLIVSLSFPARRPLRRSHHLRYVLRNRATNQVYLVILFSIYLKEDVDEATGDIKAEVLRAEETDHNFTKNIEHRHHDGDDDCHHDEKLLKEAKAQFEKMGLDVNGTRSDDDDSGPIETSLDDLD